ncbi:type II toxin-antitoxin system death-on-curing family toxin [Haloplanus halophilus]|uniref:type II toxin-antitoxin system death-on-curing family toxin n=1 Tax=Haloplanus halophilus TaxID=2949993 RepID=UPI00203BBCE9|nr:type II toxin-antitoxin system death-on-curing family toxin [Haloplanus sp. GDY1]
MTVWYPSVGDVLDIHEDIVSEYSDTSPGVRSRGDVEFALEYVGGRSFGSGPETIHETAFQSLRLLVANHPFVDGNKRTALNATAVFYLLNGYRFDYDDEIRGILKRFGTDETTVDEGHYLRTRTTAVDLAAVVERWRDDLVADGLDRPADTPPDDVMADVRGELVSRVARADRDEHREIYDALETE